MHTATELDMAEIDSVTGAGSVAYGLGLGSAGLAVAGVVTRFIPGAQVLSGGLTILSIGVGLLATAANKLDI